MGALRSEMDLVSVGDGTLARNVRLHAAGVWATLLVVTAWLAQIAPDVVKVRLAP
jgi:hypothetical protein